MQYIGYYVCSGIELIIVECNLFHKLLLTIDSLKLNTSSVGIDIAALITVSKFINALDLDCL